MTWRYDSGLVVVSVPDYATALTLTGDEQQQIGLYCGAVFATVNQPLRSCNSQNTGRPSFTSSLPAHITLIPIRRASGRGIFLMSPWGPTVFGKKISTLWEEKSAW